jgi:two-component system, cell cycle sensor histidine kinase and response regulator CckA
MSQAVHPANVVLEAPEQGARVRRARPMPTQAAIIRLMSVLFTFAIVLYVGAVSAKRQGLIDGLAEDLLISVALLCVYIPGFYAAKGALGVPTVRLAFFVAVAFMIAYRILDIADEIPALRAMPALGIGSAPFVILKQVSESAAILGPLAAFYIIIQTLGAAHTRLSKEIDRCGREMGERHRTEKALIESERKFRTLAHATSAAIFIVKDARCLYTNAAAQGILGYSLDELNRQDFWNCSVLHALNRVAGAGLCPTSPRFEIRIRTKGGEDRWLDMTLGTMELHGERVVLGTAFDITGRKHLEEQLLQSQKMDALGKLAGGVAHDFNNVLTSIFVYTEVLEDRLRPFPALSSKVSEIRKAAERAARMTRQLLAFSRHRVEQARPMDLNGIILDMNRMLESLIGPNVQLHTDLADTLAPILADPAHLEQVLLNLILNARDAMPDGGTIELCTRNIEVTDHETHSARGLAPDAYVALTIRDTGCGMDQTTLARLFEPFFTTKQEGQGTGLGLATVYSILQQYEAPIFVSSAPGQGAIFTVYFRQTEVPAEMREPAPVEVVEHAGDETVLVVEDDPELLTLAARILRSRGYVALEAAAPEEALRICANGVKSIDLIVSDVIMPCMSGPTMVKIIREQRPSLKVLYISGYTNDAFLRMDSAEPPTGFLPKPFNAQGLTARVREMLDSPCATRGIPRSQHPAPSPAPQLVRS